MARGRDCVPQLYTRRVANTSKVSSKDRIARLEAQLANITATTHGANDATFAQYDPARGSSAPVFDDQGSDTDDPTIHEGPAALPEHLRFLFDNALIGPDERIQHREDDEEARGQVCSSRYADAARARLQRLMPSRDDVAAVSSYAITWMSFYYELFPSPSVTPQRGHMTDKYSHMLEPDADIVHIASFLLTFALTARQLPQGGNGLILNGWKDVHSYVKAVMATVDAVIVSHAGIAATIEGASVSVLFLRLQLGLGRVRSLWLTLRRTVALAEIAGLPRAWYSAHYLRTRTSGAPDSLTPGSADGVYLWESICATDRMASMMFNLPAATTTYKFPRKQIVDADGSVRAQCYMFEEAGIAMRISELDDGYMHRGPEDDAYQKVLECDRELRSLKSLTPSSWWQEEAEFLSGAMLVQFWHYYLSVRYDFNFVCSGRSRVPTYLVIGEFRKKLVNDSQNTSSRCNGQRRSRPIRLQPCHMLGRLPLRGSTVFLPPPCSTRRLLRVQNRRHASLHRCNLPRALLARTRSHTIRRRKLLQSLMCRARHHHHGPRLCRTNWQRIPSCCRRDSPSSHYPSHSTQICTRSCCDFADPSSWQSPCWTQGTEFCLRQ